MQQEGSKVCWDADKMVSNTLLFIILYTSLIFLEIMVIIEVSSHPWYPTICDWFEKWWNKNLTKKWKCPTQKTLISTRTNSQYCFAKISGIHFCLIPNQISHNLWDTKDGTKNLWLPRFPEKSGGCIELWTTL